MFYPPIIVVGSVVLILIGWFVISWKLRHRKTMENLESSGIILENNWNFLLVSLDDAKMIKVEQGITVNTEPSYSMHELPTYNELFRK